MLTAMNIMTPSNAAICAESYRRKDSTKKSASAVFVFVSARRANVINARAFSYFTLMLSFDDFVVIGVTADPKPKQPFGYVNSQCPIMYPYAD